MSNHRLKQCLLCNRDLSIDSTWSDEVSTMVKNKLFNVFCKFLKIKDRGCWDFEQDNFPFCSCCVTYLEEILFNYDLLQSIYDTITSVFKNIHNIMKESINGDDYYQENRDDRSMSAGELKFDNFRKDVYQRIQNFQGKSNDEESIISLVEENSIRSEGEETDQEPDIVEIHGEGHYFNSFLHKNVQQLWGENLVKQQEVQQAASKKKLETTTHYVADENSTDYEERGGDDYNDNDNDGGFQNDNNNSSSDNVTSSGQEEEEEDESNDDNEDDGASKGKRSTRKRAKRVKSSSKSKKRTKRGERTITQLEDGGFEYREQFPIKKIEESNLYTCGKCAEEEEQVKSYEMVCDVIEHIESDHLGIVQKYGLPAYFCHICSYILRGKNAPKHIFYLHGKRRKVKKNRCRACTFVAPNVEELEEHQAEAHPIIKQEALARRSVPVRPRNTIHQTEDGKWMYQGVEIKTVTSEGGNEEIFQCALCPTRSYQTRRKAANHIGRNHIENAVEGRFTYEGVEIEMENGHFRCTLCPDRAPYRARRNLQAHILDNHSTSENLKKIPCEVCGKECRTLAQLNIHRKIHQNREYNVVCELCGKAFNSEAVLKTHVRHVHERIVPEKRFECTQCPKKFATNQHLVIHTRVHTGEFPFPCPISDCDMKFRSDKTRRVHWRRKHAEETPFKCNFCTEAFHDSTFVNSHIKKFHPEINDRRKGLGYQIIYKPKMLITRLE